MDVKMDVDVTTKMDNTNGLDMMMMPTYFFFSGNVKDFLFQGWTSHNTTEFALTVVGMALIGFMMEMCVCMELYIRGQTNMNPLNFSIVNGQADRSPLVQPLLIPPSISDLRKKRIQMHIAQTFVRVFRLIVAYVLMLAVMSYNASFIISIAAGMGLGYFICRPVCDVNQYKSENNRRPASVEEHSSGYNPEPVQL